MTKQEAINICAEVNQELDAEIDRMTHSRGGFTKKTAGDLKAGARDGARSLLSRLIAAGVFTEV
jgi:hypothetical protein